MAVAEWVRRVEVRRNNNLKIEGLSQHDFVWTHLGHEIMKENVTVNSSVADPATADLTPVFGTQLTCITCSGVKSAVE